MRHRQLVHRAAYREEAGPVVGANMDPSHLMWMVADPVRSVEALGDAIYHVHSVDLLRAALMAELVA
jgi:sugar phosphate isomerase/epimerase